MKPYSILFLSILLVTSLHAQEEMLVGMVIQRILHSFVFMVIQVPAFHRPCRIPNLCILVSKVVRFNPKIFADLFSPFPRQPIISNALMMHYLSFPNYYYSFSSYFSVILIST